MKNLDYTKIDKENLDLILTKWEYPVMTVYRTGSTVTGQIATDSDIDYLIISYLTSHMPWEYMDRRFNEKRKVNIDYIGFTRGDLESPSTITEARGNKIMYLMREINRKRILLYGEDAFFELLNINELEKVAKDLEITSDSMRLVKKVLQGEIIDGDFNLLKLVRKFFK